MTNLLFTATRDGIFRFSNMLTSTSGGILTTNETWRLFVKMALYFCKLQNLEMTKNLSEIFQFCGTKNMYLNVNRNFAWRLFWEFSENLLHESNIASFIWSIIKIRTRPQLFHVCSNFTKRILAVKKFQNDEFRADLALTSNKGRFRI